MIKKYINTNYDTLTVGTSYLLDAELGIRERGLLTTMLLIDADNFSIKTLRKIIPEGECQISSVLKKLEDARYMVRIRKMINGRQEWDYIVSDHKLDEDVLKQSYRADKSKPVVKPQYKNLFKKKETKNSKNPSVDFSVNTAKNNPENYKSYLETIKNNIGYDYLLDVEDDKEIVDSVLAIITDTVCCNTQYIRVCKQDMPAEIVKSIFLKLNQEHIRYVLDNMRKTASNIGNIISYIRTSLYNAVNTLKMHVAASVNNATKHQNSNNNKSVTITEQSYDINEFEKFAITFSKNIKENAEADIVPEPKKITNSIPTEESSKADIVPESKKLTKEDIADFLESLKNWNINEGILVE